jgi:flagellar biosynthetic protein FlhB
MVQRMAGFFRRGLVLDHGLATRADTDAGSPGRYLARCPAILRTAVRGADPAALLSPFFLGSWNFSPKALQPDLSRLNPLKGLGRLVSWNGLVELVKAVAKASLLGGVAVLVLWRERATCWRCLRNRSSP